MTRFIDLPPLALFTFEGEDNLATKSDEASYNIMSIRYRCHDVLRPVVQHKGDMVRVSELVEGKFEITGRIYTLVNGFYTASNGDTIYLHNNDLVRRLT